MRLDGLQMSETRTPDDLVLVPASSSEKIGRWPPSDYDVRCGGKLIGRIMKTYYAPTDAPWAWSINAFERGQRPRDMCQGYAPDLDAALEAFREAWTGQQKTEPPSL